MTDVADLTVPDTGDPDDLEDFLNSDRFAKVYLEQDPSAMADILKTYTAAAAKRQKDMNEEIAINKQRELARLLVENGQDPDEVDVAALAAAPTPQPIPSQAPARLDPQARLAYARTYNTDAPGAGADRLFGSHHEFLASIWHMQRDPKVLAKRAELESITNAYTSTIGADGGFLIPEQMRAELLSVALATAVVRPRARVLPMATPRVPIPSIDETSRASSVFGGIVAYWTEEGAAATISSAKFGQVALEAKTLTGYTEIPNETMQDAILFGAFFDQTFPQAMSHFEDVAFTNGTGVGEPLGWRSAGSMVSVAKESGQTAATVNWTNVAKMFARLFPSSIANSVWVISPDVFPQLALMETSAGAGGLWIGPGEGAMAPPTTLLGRPVVTSDKLPAVGTVGDINLVDFSYYLIGDRQTMTASSSEHFKFSSRKTSFLITERVDGRPWLDSAITPPVGSSTLSAFVDLATRA